MYLYWLNDDFYKIKYDYNVHKTCLICGILYVFFPFMKVIFSKGIYLWLNVYDDLQMNFLMKLCIHVTMWMKQLGCQTKNP